MQQRELAISTTLLAQELLRNVQGSGGSRFAKEMRASSLKMRSMATAYLKLTMTNRAMIKADPLTTYMRGCWRTQCQPFYGSRAFEANWKGKKAQEVGASWADWKKKNHCFEVVFSYSMGFPCGSAGKESASNAGDLGLIGGLGRPPGEGYPP